MILLLLFPKLNPTLLLINGSSSFASRDTIDVLVTTGNVVLEHRVNELQLASPFLPCENNLVAYGYMVKGI